MSEFCTTETWLQGFKVKYKESYLARQAFRIENCGRDEKTRKMEASGLKMKKWALRVTNKDETRSRP